jgi:hypothetical protein
MTQYERRKTLSIYWYNKASDLFGAAGLVWAGMERDESADAAEWLGLGAGFSFRAACWPVYQMLCGLALELFLKASIVEQGRQPETTHKLLALWAEAGLAATKEQEGLLAILTASISWAGKYPVPKLESDFNRMSDLEDDYLWDARLVGSQEIKILRRNNNLTWDSFGRLWTLAHANIHLGDSVD